MLTGAARRFGPNSLEDVLPVLLVLPSTLRTSSVRNCKAGEAAAGEFPCHGSAGRHDWLGGRSGSVEASQVEEVTLDVGG